ncbi:kinase-like protein [Coccomyxa subellipsoidea C-169]|uniref:Kinase-like protein n=1 Tax=Coccomyxa subellipsoidea (strain C-169) TaxID=574566 RepID=I0YIY8_COCSC|nr:kinase-like protein [Coccomyxa subellipsoidea C-169]EIE18357.1 kinase-like protein [Coccomyxa subellipsoidea C-169]|eukprot:XP_005642901.1 kinase-like protein [Coccomyxa subellipsoidea C-169]
MQEAAVMPDLLAGHPRYRKLNDLNEGTFGVVMLALDITTNEQVAIKLLERGAGISRGVVREVLNHRLCVAHPNIVQFREIFLTNKHLAIVMEYASGGDMFDYVIKNKGSGPGEGLHEDLARGFFQQLILALDFCQKLGIANRDIKLENTLLSEGQPLPQVKLCDFGYSKNEFVDSRPKSVSGTPDYIAPEILLNDHYDGKTADIWSCGVMLYVMLTAVLPFAKRGDDRANNLVRLQQLFPRIVAGQYQPPRRASDACKDLLKRMLTPDPNNRITAPEIMQHPWFVVNLDPATMQMNAQLLQRAVPPQVQTPEQIEAIVKQARVAQAAVSPNWAEGL